MSFVTSLTAVTVLWQVLLDKAHSVRSQKRKVITIHTFCAQRPCNYNLYKPVGSLFILLLAVVVEAPVLTLGLGAKNVFSRLALTINLKKKDMSRHDQGEKNPTGNKKKRWSSRAMCQSPQVPILIHWTQLTVMSLFKMKMTQFFSLSLSLTCTNYRQTVSQRCLSHLISACLCTLSFYFTASQFLGSATFYKKKKKKP